MSTVLQSPATVYPQVRARPAVGAARLAYLDVYRGLLTVLMSMDHAAYFLWTTAREHSFTFWDGPFASEETAPELVVRLLSNLAAPGFFLLLGVGLSFYAEARRKIGWSDRTIGVHLVERGAILILLQFLVENPLWSLKPGAAWLNYGGVLFALGATMICSAALRRLPSIALLAVGAFCVVLQEVVIRSFALDGDALPTWLALLLVPGKSSSMVVYFSFLPWLGIASWGIALGRALAADERRTLRGAGLIGLSMFLAAIALRYFGGVGNLGIVEGRGLHGFLSFVKYGPSPAFVCWNVGLTLAALPVAAWISRRTSTLTAPLTAFGRSALFFYVAHLALFGVIAFAIGSEQMSGIGATAVWAIGLLWLWPLCNLYARFKAGTSPDSLWRLL